MTASSDTRTASTVAANRKVSTSPAPLVGTVNAGQEAPAASITPTMDACRAAGIREWRTIGEQVWEIIGATTATVTVSAEDGTEAKTNRLDKPFFAVLLPGGKSAFMETGGLIVFLREGHEKADRLEVWEKIAKHYGGICHDHPTIKPALDTYLSGEYGGITKVIEIGGKKDAP